VLVYNLVKVGVQFGALGISSIDACAVFSRIIHLPNDGTAASAPQLVLASFTMLLILVLTLF